MRLVPHVILLVICLSPGAYAQKDAAIPAADITKEFATDEAAAKKKYALKTITVEGTVESMIKTPDGKRNLILKGHEAGAGVFCSDLPDSVLDKLKDGDKVQVTGLAVGKVGPWFVMGMCKVAGDAGTAPAPKKTADKKMPEKKAEVVRGGPVEGLVTPTVRNWKVVGLVPKLAYIADRDYTILKYPKEMEDGHVVIRDSGQVNNWVQKGQLTLAKDATLYAAMLVKINDAEKVTQKQLDAMAADGWTILTEPFETTSPDTSWAWRVTKKKFSKGDVNPALPKEFPSYVTHAIYVFK
jgi:hypothetical protein